jgi:hypothetical protein
MRTLITVFCLAVAGVVPVAAQPSLTNIVQASLSFEEASNPPPQYPHLLQVYLHLKNSYDTDVTWICDDKLNIEAQLFDGSGKAAHRAPVVARIMSTWRPYLLPYHSQLDWMISDDEHTFISIEGANTSNYVLMIGSEGWLILKDSLSAYSLEVCVKGIPWSSQTGFADKMCPKLLFKAGPTPITLR